MENRIALILNLKIYHIYGMFYLKFHLNACFFSVKNLTEIYIGAILKAKNSFAGILSRVYRKFPQNRPLICWKETRCLSRRTVTVIYTYLSDSGER